MSPPASRSAIVGGALMALAHAQRTAGDLITARVTAKRGAAALNAALGPGHSETMAALTFE